MKRQEDYYDSTTMQLVDTHCHLQDERLSAFIDAVLVRARATGVCLMVCCGTGEKDWLQLDRLAAGNPDILPAWGLHPWFIADRSPHWLETLRQLLEAHPKAPVGEVGLDHAIDEASYADQESVFRSQLELAIELKRPVSIHCRRAWSALIDVLTSLPALPRGFVVHSFSGSVEMIDPLVKLGACFSFSGSITLSGNKRAHKSAAAVPADRLLIETDAPDMPPVIDGVRNADLPNEPANLVYVIEKIAALRGLTPGAVASITTANARRIFVE